MPVYQRPRGTADVLPEAAARWRRLETLIAAHSASFGFGEIRTPIFEETDLYSRTSGASSDIVRKEMYTFKDRGGRSLTLRPEGTAGAARAYLENGLASAPQPVKLWYVGPMFRYDRPQAGRFRQHTQYGVEIFGSGSPLADIEVILVAHELFSRVGLENLIIHLNSIGCPACRPAYREKLVAYFAARVKELCPDCRERYAHNPLRLFDCKNERCGGLLREAPLSADNLCPECGAHLARVKEGLAALGIRHAADPSLVRGLDYYRRTVFEIVQNDAAGSGVAGLTICGGGRYDGLIEELGGPPTPGVGFGLGLERLLSVMEAEGLDVPDAPCAGAGGVPSPTGQAAGAGGAAGLVFVAAVGADTELEALRLALELRRAGRVVMSDLLGRSLKAQFKAADRARARWVALLGEEELAGGVVTLRDLRTGEQSTVPREKVAEALEVAGK